MTANKTVQPKTGEGNASGVDYETKFAEFEYAIWHLGAAFTRWRRDCLGSVSDVSLNSTEASILHAVHMNGTDKGLVEIVACCIATT